MFEGIVEGPRGNLHWCFDEKGAKVFGSVLAACSPWSDENK
jgi:hypothetical protein